MIWVTFDDIVQLHRLIIRKTGGLDGLRDSGLLEAALAAPFQSFGGEDLFRSPVEKIVRLGYGLASNHAFLDGNKRIGALAMQTLLATNGYSFPMSNDELADMFLSIAAGSAGEADLLAWTQQYLQQMRQWMP